MPTYSPTYLPKYFSAVLAGALTMGAIASIMLATTPARAEIQYPWCAEYSGDEGNGTNCGFSTLAQCRATISGIGGNCYENPMYSAPAPRPKKARRH